MANEHDRRYRLLFSNPIVVQRLLEGFVQEPFVGQIDFSSLKQEKTDTISPAGEQRASDVIWSLNLADSRVYIYILIELQRTVDRTMALRFLRYVTAFYESRLREQRSETPVPPLFPILIYNGDARWTAKTSVQDMIHSVIPADYIPRLHYLPILINEIPRERLLRIRNAVSAVFLAENIEREHLEETADAFVGIIKEELPEAKEAVAQWLADYFALTETPSELAEALEDPGRTKAMLETTFHKLIQEGREEGRQEGRQEGREEGRQKGRQEGRQEGREEGREEAATAFAKKLVARGFRPDEVADLTGLSLERVREIAEDDNGEHP